MARSAQDDLFVWSHTRGSDPDTSRAAAAMAGMRAGTIKRKILTFMLAIGEPVSWEVISQHTGLSEGQCWRRLSDLKNDRLIEDSGLVHINRSNSPSIKWRVK